MIRKTGADYAYIHVTFGPFLGRVHWKELTRQPSNFELRAIYWLTTEVVAQSSWLRG